MSCIAVIDVETTGLSPYRHNRIVEIAAVVIQPGGKVLREFVTLVNPDRDIGPTRIHGLTAHDVLGAPRFAEIAGALLETLEGCVALAGHNVRFDHSFLTVEFQRLDISFPESPTLCTMHLAGGGNLSSACLDYEIEFEGDTHSALNDARATGRLLFALLNDAPQLAATICKHQPITWPLIAKSPVEPLTRADSRRRQAEPPNYLQRLLTRVQPDLPADQTDSAILAYTALLDRVLEDRHIDQEEGQVLIELATGWGITGDTIRKTHWDYLLRLGAAALADGELTDAERRDLHQVSSLLGIDSLRLDEILKMAAEKLAETLIEPTPTAAPLGVQKFAGKQVCFTGECRCLLNGEPITREMAAELATQRGMVVAESVTKKLDLLVVADPLSQSGKAKKARQYGIRIMHEPVFWKAVDVEVQ